MKPPPPPLPLRRLILPALLRFQIVLCAAIFLNDHVLEITDIRGPSMAPTLSPTYTTTGARDRVAWAKWRFNGGDTTTTTSSASSAPPLLSRGDVVLFATPHNPDGIAVKRVVALAGDAVTPDVRRRPRASLDGRPNPAARAWDRAVAAGGGEVVVPPGHVWVEGDNWRDTYDSNSYGPISRGLVRGKALALVWPWREFGKRPWEEWEGRTRVRVAGSGGVGGGGEGTGHWRMRDEADG